MQRHHQYGASDMLRGPTRGGRSPRGGSLCVIEAKCESMHGTCTDATVSIPRALVCMETASALIAFVCSAWVCAYSL